MRKLSIVQIMSITLTILATRILSQINIAIIPLSPSGVSKEEASILTDRLRTEVHLSGMFKIIERDLMDDILKEQSFQLSNCTSDACLVEIGKLLNAKQIIGGNVGLIGNTYTVSLRIVDIETGVTLSVATFDQDGSLNEMLKTGISECVATLINNYVAKHKDNNENKQSISEIFNNGVNKFFEEDYEKSIEIFTRIISIRPDCTETYLYRGSAYGELDKNIAAVNDFTNYIQQMNRNSNIGYYLRSLAYIKNMEYTQAINDLNKVMIIGLVSENGDEYYYTGCCYCCIGDESKMIANYEKASNMGHPYAQKWISERNSEIDRNKDYLRAMKLLSNLSEEKRKIYGPMIEKTIGSKKPRYPAPKPISFILTLSNYYQHLGQ